MNIWALLERAGSLAGLDVGGMSVLRAHSNQVVVLPHACAVARVGGGSDAIGRAERAVDVCRWLAGVEFPAVRPLDVDQPVVLSGTPVTFWHLINSAQRGSAADLGALLRQLHRLVPPDALKLKVLDPLARLRAALHLDRVLPNDDRAWLADRAVALTRTWAGLDSPLGTGIVHGDAQIGNVIRDDGGRAWLADWDNVALGQREWDLLGTQVEHRFGVPPQSRDDFVGAYGHDLTIWPQWSVLREVFELRSLAAHIRRANEGSRPHLEEAMHRINTLRSGDCSAQWHPVG